jgi:hypothetical protein
MCSLLDSALIPRVVATCMRSHAHSSVANIARRATTISHRRTLLPTTALRRTSLHTHRQVDPNGQARVSDAVPPAYSTLDDPGLEAVAPVYAETDAPPTPRADECWVPSYAQLQEPNEPPPGYEATANASAASASGATVVVVVDPALAPSSRERSQPAIATTSGSQSACALSTHARMADEYSEACSASPCVSETTISDDEEGDSREDLFALPAYGDHDHGRSDNPRTDNVVVVHGSRGGLRGVSRTHGESAVDAHAVKSSRSQDMRAVSEI